MVLTKARLCRCRGSTCTYIWWPEASKWLWCVWPSSVHITAIFDELKSYFALFRRCATLTPSGAGFIAQRLSFIVIKIRQNAPQLSGSVDIQNGALGDIGTSCSYVRVIDSWAGWLTGLVCQSGCDVLYRTHITACFDKSALVTWQHHGNSSCIFRGKYWPLLIYRTIPLNPKCLHL